MKPEPELARIGEYVRARRLGQALTQREASRMADVSETTWNQVERGIAVSDLSMAKVGSVFKVSIADLREVGRGGPEPKTIEGRGTVFGGRTDYNSVIPDLPEHVQRAIDELIEGEQRREER